MYMKIYGLYHHGMVYLSLAIYIYYTDHVSTGRDLHMCHHGRCLDLPVGVSSTPIFLLLGLASTSLIVITAAFP